MREGGGGRGRCVVEGESSPGDHGEGSRTGSSSSQGGVSQGGCAKYKCWYFMIRNI